MNLLKAWPELEKVPDRNNLGVAYYLSLLAECLLRRDIPEQAVPLMSIELANEILDAGEALWRSREQLDLKVGVWLRRVRRIINEQHSTIPTKTD